MAKTQNMQMNIYFELEKNLNSAKKHIKTKAYHLFFFLCHVYDEFLIIHMSSSELALRM